jgi:hypothetical protein
MDSGCVKPDHYNLAAARVRRPVAATRWPVSGLVSNNPDEDVLNEQFR